MSKQFREYLKKIGSGAHTSKDLSRAEAADAMSLMLTQKATPAQIGAFLIAHRIKRPTGEELAGMLDAYNQLGPKVPALASEKTVVILSQPYDGRDRTFPLSPLTALLVAAAGCPVLQHGGGRMPTKEGVPLIDLWRCLGVDWRFFPLEQIQESLASLNLGFVYLPRHFPLAQDLIPYREQIGKRPPLATLELVWAPYSGPCHVVAGFVHPPTETMIRAALTLRGTEKFTTVKGLEGSCDLPQERAAIIGLYDLNQGDNPLTRLRLHAEDYGLGGKNPVWTDLSDAQRLMTATLAGEPTPLVPALLWNSGFYLWRHCALDSLGAGIELARELLAGGQAREKLTQMQTLCKTSMEK